MILTIRTETPTAKISLLETDGTEIVSESWEAGRQLSSQLLMHIKTLLSVHQKAWSDISGVVVFRGPGSFTGLRIGITVANTIAYAQQVPVVGSVGEQWQQDGLKRLAQGENDTTVVPEYGAPPNITKPKR